MKLSFKLTQYLWFLGSGIVFQCPISGKFDIWLTLAQFHSNFQRYFLVKWTNIHYQGPK